MSWDPSMGRLVEAMGEAGIDTSSITTVALTHAHGDHINGLLAPDGRRTFNNLSKILIGEDAVEEFLAEPGLAEFRSLLAPIRGGDRPADHLLAVAIAGHAAGHMGYLLSTGEDDILFCGDLIHVPAAQFAQPELTWAYDDDESVARASRIKVLQASAKARGAVVMTFHRWGVRCGLDFQGGEEGGVFGERLLARLQDDAHLRGRYNAVLIDEAQDSPCSWFRCARLALK